MVAKDIAYLNSRWIRPGFLGTGGDEWPNKKIGPTAIRKEIKSFGQNSAKDYNNFMMVTQNSEETSRCRLTPERFSS